jgi:hypothetical protein
MKPMLCLSKTEKLFWPILTNARTSQWSDVDNLLASQMCRDLATVEEIAKADCGEDLLPGICQRIHQGALLMKLDANPSGHTAQHKIIRAIFAGV